MNHIEFSKICRPLNEQYKKLFGVVPTPADYACNREQYLTALQKAIFEKRELSEYLDSAPVLDCSRYSY